MEVQNIKSNSVFIHTGVIIPYNIRRGFKPQENTSKSKYISGIHVVTGSFMHQNIFHPIKVCLIVKHRSPHSVNSHCLSICYSNLLTELPMCFVLLYLRYSPDRRVP